MLGALGACFGRVVTLDSPKAREPGTFNWGETLWHEMAHVITLQLSGNRLPRWLSEGTSVFEERRARARMGPRHGHPVRARDRSRQGAQDSRSELRVQQLADDQLRLLPGVAASSSTSPTPTASGSCARWSRRMPTAATPRRRSRRRLASTSTSCRRASTQLLDKRYATLRRALKVPEGLKDRHAGSTRSRRIAAAQSRQLRGADGARRGAGGVESGCGDCGVREGGRDRFPTCPAKTARMRRLPRVAMKKGDKARAAQALETLIGYTPYRRRSRRAQLATLLDANKEPARAADGAEARGVGRSVRRRGARAARPAGAECRRQRRGHSAVPRRAGGEAARQGQRARRSRRSAVARPARRTKRGSRCSKR